MPEIDLKVAVERLRILYSAWKNDRAEFGNADCLLFHRGKNSEDTGYTKSASLQLWLFGYELPETALLITEKAITILCSKKKGEFLGPLAKHGDDALPDVTIKLRNKADADKENLSAFSESSKESYDGKTVGLFEKELKDQAGPFANGLASTFEGIAKSNVSVPCGKLMATKNNNEVELIEQAANLSSDILHKRLRKKILDVVDSDEQNAQHSEIAQIGMSFLESPEGDKAKLINKLKMDISAVESCYEPIIQSGSTFSLKPSAQSNDDALKWPGPILCSVGARYHMHCTNIARTYMIDPAPSQRKDYAFLLEVQKVALKTMKSGKAVSGTMTAVKKFVSEKRPDLISKLPKTCGFCMTYEFKESALTLNEKCPATFESNMVFNLAVGFENVGEDKYAVLIADTILIKDDEPMILTNAAKLETDVTFDFKDDEDDEDEKEAERLKAAQEKLAESSGRRAKKSDTGNKSNSENKAKQLEGIQQKAHEEMKKRLLKQQDDEIKTLAKQKKVSCYSDRTKMSGDDCRKLRIFIDKKNEALILPIFGIPTPFHISTVKSCNKTDEDVGAALRVVFDTPTGVNLKKEYEMRGKGLVYLKEITFRSDNVSSLGNAARIIKEQQKRYKQQQTDKAQMATFVAQDELVRFGRGQYIPTIQNIFCKPTAEKKKVQGTLEAHSNGFLWTSRKGEVVKLLYNRIRYAFYQPPENENSILLHFNLIQGIMIGKKQYTDIQFYVEVGETSTDLSKRTGAYDRDELESEQRERQQRNRLKKTFQAFIAKASVIPKDKELEFEEPSPDLGFHGVPNKENVLCMPTTNCLVSLTGTTPFVLALDDVERVSFERVSFQLRNFDIVFIYKDYTRKVSSVTAIPSKSLEDIKEWLTGSLEIPFHESTVNLNWTKLMKTITDDPEGFVDEGGWSMIFGGAGEDEEEEEDSDDESEAYESPNSSDLEESSDEMSSDEESSSNSEYSDASLGSDEEEGMDWDELMDKAKKDDRVATQREVQRDQENFKRKKVPQKGQQAKRRKY